MAIILSLREIVNKMNFDYIHNPFPLLSIISFDPSHNISVLKSTSRLNYDRVLLQKKYILKSNVLKEHCRRFHCTNSRNCVTPVAFYYLQFMFFSFSLSSFFKIVPVMVINKSNFVSTMKYMHTSVRGHVISIAFFR